MKKQLLLSSLLTLSNLSIALEIPSIKTIREAQFKDIFGTDEPTQEQLQANGIKKTLSEVKKFISFFSIMDLLADDVVIINLSEYSVSFDNIKDAVEYWHNEDPEVFAYTFDLIKLLYPKVVYGLGGDYPKMIAQTTEIYKKAKKTLPKATCLDVLLVYSRTNGCSVDKASRCSKAIECLKKLGYKQTYNDYQLNLLAQIPSHGNYDYEYYEKVYKALEALIETYNK